MDKSFYITTPIYYPSAKPHMGHAYSSIIADFFARFKKIDGFDVSFLTGTDEHGLKIQRAAEKKGVETLKFCDEISQTFRDLSSILNLTNTDFIRTTENRHKKTVQHLWKELEKNDDIYLSNYSGWYSVSDEAFYNEDEIEEVEGKKISISSKSPVEWIEEESYFFRLSKWEKPLLDFYKKNPNFISPASRKNEVISFVKSGLKDLSVSRKSFSWGIKVPGNDNHVIYVWLDALTNYISALNYPNTDDSLFKKFWPASVHLIGKDILRFHAIYWPAFLLAAKIPLPKKVYGHGWILSGDEKMSKSKGNILDPVELVNEFGSDEIRYYLMKDVIFGLDGKINIGNFKITLNDLANNIGNLSNRIFTILNNNYECKVPEINNNYTINSELLVNKNKMIKFIDKFELHNYTKYIHFYSSIINKYVNDNEPWNRKINSEQNIKNILFSTLVALKNIFILLYPVTPIVSKKFLECLNIQDHDISLKYLNTKLKTGEKLTKPEILFKKF